MEMSNYKRVIIFTIPMLLFLGFVSYTFTFSFFSDAATSTSNTFAAAAVFPSPSISPTPSSSPSNIADHLVISEVQIDGGPSNGDNDFIEIYNPTNSAIDLNGYRLVSRTGNSSSDDNIFNWSSTTLVQAHGYYLWASSKDSSYPLSIGANASSDPVLGSSTSIALRIGDLNSGTIIDALSWNNGSNTLVEGTLATAPGGNQSLERKAYSTSTVASMMSGADVSKGNGFDTNNNAIDFILRTTSQPQNSSSAIEIP